MTKPSIKTWLMAIRPKTLYAAVAPVFMGTMLALSDGVHHFLIAAVVLVGAMSIQTLTNLINDYFDFKKGADTADRTGPPRVMQSGLVTAPQMRSAIIINLLIALICSIYLIAKGGVPIAIIAAISILGAFLYTAGPAPLGYLGLGEIFVIIFFGPVAVAGTYYVQSLELNPAVIWAGFAPGFLSAAVLAVNNIRDFETDRIAYKRTLVVRFGRSFGYYEYLFFVLGSSLIPVIIYSFTQDHLMSLLACSISLWAIPLIKTVLTATEGPAFNHALADTAKLLMIYSLLFSIGWLL